jgi:hypothetical protein
MEEIMSDDDIKKLDARLTKVESTLSQFQSGASALRYGPIVDPGPDPWGGGGYGGWGGWGGWRPTPFPIPDPAPIDYSRLSAETLEATLHSINAQKARLASVEALVTQHLEKAKKQG